MQNSDNFLYLRMFFFQEKPIVPLGKLNPLPGWTPFWQRPTGLVFFVAPWPWRNSRFSERDTTWARAARDLRLEDFFWNGQLGTAEMPLGIAMGSTWCILTYDDIRPPKKTERPVVSGEWQAFGVDISWRNSNTHNNSFHMIYIYIYI